MNNHIAYEYEGLYYYQDSWEDMSLLRGLIMQDIGKKFNCNFRKEIAKMDNPAIKQALEEWLWMAHLNILNKLPKIETEGNDK